MRKSWLYYPLCVLACMTLVLKAQATTISYPDFADVSDLQLLQLACQKDNRLCLTPIKDRTYDKGVAWYRHPVYLPPNYAFTTTFQFQLYGFGPFPGADGFTFTIQTSPNGVNAFGDGGGYLGYGKYSSTGNEIVPSVAVEFDTVKNLPWTTHYDLNNNHIGINSNSAFSVSGTPVVNDNLPFDLNGGDIYQAWIEYDGITMRVWLGPPGSRPETPLLTHTFSLGKILGTTKVYVGFTAGYASYIQYHEIISWEFSSAAGPPIPVPAIFLLSE